MRKDEDTRFAIMARNTLTEIGTGIKSIMIKGLFYKKSIIMRRDCEGDSMITSSQ